MREKKFTVVIGNNEHEMCFTLEALAAAVDKYGDLEKMNQALFAGKENATVQDNVKLLTETAWMAAEMINAAQKADEYETGKKRKPITAEYIRSKITFSEAQIMRETVMEAVVYGLGANNVGDEDTDFELQELAKKNEAAENELIR